MCLPTRSVKVSWELVRNAVSWAPFLTYWLRICFLIKSLTNLYAPSNMSCTVPRRVIYVISVLIHSCKYVAKLAPAFCNDSAWATPAPREKHNAYPSPFARQFNCILNGLKTWHKIIAHTVSYSRKCANTTCNFNHYNKIKELSGSRTYFVLTKLNFVY